jgi:hypothetical protein
VLSGTSFEMGLKALLRMRYEDERMVLSDEIPGTSWKSEEG